MHRAKHKQTVQSRFENYLNTLAWKEKIQILGSLSRSEVLKKCLDLMLCMSSRYESWGIAIAEAMSQGLVIINMANGGARDLTKLANGFNVFSQNEFNQALVDLFSQSNIYSKCAEESLQAHKELASWDTIAKKCSVGLKK